MPIKIENQSSIKLPKKTEETIQSVLDVLPQEHLRGLTKVVLVDKIVPDSRIPLPKSTDLPCIYHPRMGNVQPWGEIAIQTILSVDGFFKKLAARLNFKPNLAYIVLRLQAQHFYLTLSHGIKKHQYESAMRTYVEKYHEIWREAQAGWRAKLFKPLRPWMDKWTRKLRKKYMEEQKRRSA
jgi:hypothetical protein